jgi:hypothetical protein
MGALRRSFLGDFAHLTEDLAFYRLDTVDTRLVNQVAGVWQKVTIC